MGTASLNITVNDRRMLSGREAATYCGVPVKRFAAVCHVTPVELPNVGRRYDKRDLDTWIDSLKSDMPGSDDDIVRRLSA